MDKQIEAQLDGRSDVALDAMNLLRIVLAGGVVDWSGLSDVVVHAAGQWD